MNDPYEVRLKLLGRRAPHVGVRTIFKDGYEPRQFSDMQSAVAFAWCKELGPNASLR
jgi:hypothetical protein